MPSLTALITLLLSTIVLAETPYSGEHSESENKERIFYKFHAQGDIIPEYKILDGNMIPIGSTTAKDKYGIWRDLSKPYKGEPSYHFMMKDDKGRRVELHRLFVTQRNIDKAGLTPDQVRMHQLNSSLYHFGSGEAKQGERWVYEYGLYLPSSLNEKSQGIITQWHGMPDRTTIKTSDGKLVKYSPEDFHSKVLSKMTFQKSIGYNKGSDKPNGIIKDSGGNPPVALKIHNRHLFLICRIDRSRVTVPGERVHIKPPLVKSRKSPEGNKTVYGIWEKPLAKLPKDQWMDMKFDIYWPKWKKNGSGIVEDGNIKFYIDGKLQADWTGPLGNNDEHGTYFKYGIYKPGPTGIEVWEAGFKQHLINHKITTEK